jgi:diacylglycerol kinase (ATP)
VELTRQAIEELGYTQFIVIGGDGTLNEVINGIFSSDCASPEKIVIAAIPSGTGNDWIRQWNITGKTNLTDYFQSGKRMPVDVGSITEKAATEKKEHYFLNAVGFGFDGDVVYRTDLLRRLIGAHSWCYSIAVLFSIFMLRYQQLSLETEKEQIKGDVLTICIGNGRYTGGGLMQTPTANPCDKMFDIMLVQRIRLSSIPSLLSALLKQKIDLHPLVKIIRSHTVSINASQSIRCETDGVLLNIGFPVEIKVLPHKIQFLIP